MHVSHLAYKGFLSIGQKLAPEGGGGLVKGGGSGEGVKGGGVEGVKGVG